MHRSSRNRNLNGRLTLSLDLKTGGIQRSSLDWPEDWEDACHLANRSDLVPDDLLPLLSLACTQSHNNRDHNTRADICEQDVWYKNGWCSCRRGWSREESVLYSQWKRIGHAEFNFDTGFKIILTVKTKEGYCNDVLRSLSGSTSAPVLHGLQRDSPTRFLTSYTDFKGTVQQDFRPPVFFILWTSLGHWPMG